MIKRILRRFTNNYIYIATCAVLSLYLPVLLHRTFCHEALSAQWIILFAFDICFSIKEKKPYLLVAILAVLSAGTHMYFVLLCGMVLVGACIVDIIDNKRILVSVLILFEYISICAGTIYIEGGFSTGIESANSKLFGVFNCNLNTFINPLGQSRILKDLKLYGWGQGEGQAYLGLGLIVFFALAIIIFIAKQATHKYVKKEAYKTSLMAIAIVGVMGLLFSIIPDVTFNEHLLFKVYIPKIIINYISAFRCNARGIWLFEYGILIIALIMLSEMIDGIKLSVVIIICLAVQIYDLTPSLRYEYNWCNYIQENPNELYMFNLEDLESRSENVVAYSGFLDRGQYDLLTEIYVWALDNKMTVNRIYLARDEDDAYMKRTKDALNHINDSTLYIFGIEDIDQLEKYGLRYTQCGEYLVAYK